LREQGLKVPLEAISCGVELERFTPDPGVDRRKTRLHFGLDPDRILFLYVGRVDRDKNLDLLLQAVHLLDRQDVQVAIAGRGNHLHGLQQLGRELKLDYKLVFTGFVPDPELPSLLNSSDIFAMPSAAELQSISTLQAMSTGLPVWAANARALPELVRDGCNGCLFRPGDAADAASQMARLADNMEKWPQMGAASLAIAQSHSLLHTLERYEALYRKLNSSIPPLISGG
jgi:1,2-diacylglycerol 3-alpha-glucosyltransferase